MSAQFAHADGVGPFADAGIDVEHLKHALGGNEVALVQWLRFGGSGFLRIIGVGAKDDWDALFTRFRAVRDGIEAR